MSNRTHVDTLWFTRCAGFGRGGVPTASGVAYRLGLFEDEFGGEGIRLRTLQDEDAQGFWHAHYDHLLPSLVREGGNLFAIPAKAQGAPTRLIGLTWIDEGQSIITRADSDIRAPKDLVGRRLALPALRVRDILENRRGRSIERWSSLHGYKGALASAGLDLDAVRLVEVGDPERDNGRATGRGGDRSGGWSDSLEAVRDGRADAAYVKGGGAQDGARELGLVVGIDLDRLPERRFRVNNGTPRPITVHEHFLDNHHDLLVRFLERTLEAAEWAKGHLEGVRQIIQEEIGATAEGVASAYRDGFHLSLAPDLSDERLALFARQKDFQLAHGLLDRDFDFDAWIDRRPLAEAEQRLKERQGTTASLRNAA